MKRFNYLLEEIEKQNLLNPFYQEIFKGVHKVGMELNYLHIEWNTHIIENTNEQLLNKLGSDERVLQYLNDNNLEEDGDRSYSAIIEDEIKPYIEAFSHTAKVVEALEEFIVSLNLYDDLIFNKKNQYIKYLKALIDAFSCSDKTMLIKKWADVDIAWMQIDTPIQIGHPLEYYEDHYRKAVAMEWDLRISDVSIKNSRVNDIKDTFLKLYQELKTSNSNSIYNSTIYSLDKSNLYIGRPAMYYGAELNGLFSAQVVPNDEDVSAKYGKKIFAFSHKILDDARAKPLMRLPVEIFGRDYITKQREFLFTQDKIWHKLYDISTIGHEYGHILWIDSDSELLMNKSGNFKNIEEFKATTGGVVSFFYNEDEELKFYLLNDIIKRSIGLIGWMEVGEVRPYYCEGLIHLDILFESGVLGFDDRLTINLDNTSYERVKKLYISTYKELAKLYIKKEDALEFLNKYIVIKNRVFMPKNKTIDKFVNYYYKKYKEIGTKIDQEDNKSKYI